MQLDAILNPFQESYLLGERIISFDRAETNHDKVKHDDAKELMRLKKVETAVHGCKRWLSVWTL